MISRRSYMIWCRESSGCPNDENKKKWYEELFANYGHSYDREVFTTGTIGECNFIEEELSFDKSLSILDLGCGTGRHSIELTRRGYKVTGADLSDAMLERARAKAAEAGLEIHFLQRDARELGFDREFNLVIMLCEGGFSLMETDEMNFSILKNAVAALRPGGKLIFTTLNGLFPLFHSVKDFLNQSHQEGNATYSENSFDLMTFRDHNLTTIHDDDGNPMELDCNERYYVPSEISWLLKSLSMQEIHIGAARLGEFSREHALSTEDYEMLIIARKAG
jgi:2-polyprenyl-3-methyl-5-hydroxy-6-metoxy-1,4-benzoquinol methylase